MITECPINPNCFRNGKCDMTNCTSLKGHLITDDRYVFLDQPFASPEETRAALPEYIQKSTLK